MRCHASAQTRRNRLPRSLAVSLHSRSRMKAAAILFALLAIAVPASAQDAVGTSALSSSTVTWRFAAGKGSLWIRDVASSKLGRRVDASPVSWEGHGVVFTAERDRGTIRRLHHLEASFEQSGGAVFRTPLADFPRPAGDRAIRMAGRYEYRRYPFVDLGLRGFDVGIGLQGGAEFASVTQHFDPSIEVRVREANLSTGLVAAARLRLRRRAQVEVVWVNGGALVRTTQRHSAAAEGTVHDWGVGYLTDLTARADVRVSNRMTLFMSYFETGRGRFVLLDASASGRRRWMVGVSHGR
jgi:hypothetical protein